MTTYDFIESNNKKTLALCVLFPLVVSLLLVGVSAIFRYYYKQSEGGSTYDPQLVADWWQHTALVIAAVLVANIIWILISYHSSKNFSVRWLTNITRADSSHYWDLCKTVENIAITAGIKTPDVYVMETDAMNAFAAGTNPDNSVVVFTRGLLEKLDKSELEGVIAHEIAHIINRDTRLMMVLIYSSSMFAIAADICFSFIRTTSRSRGKGKAGVIIALLLLAITFYVIYFIVAPLIRLAVSRKREFLADSTSALLTRNPDALARALLKINDYSQVSELNNFTHAQLCIESPGKSFMTSLLSTHPPIHDRVEALMKMAK